MSTYGEDNLAAVDILNSDARLSSMAVAVEGFKLLRYQDVLCVLLAVSFHQHLQLAYR